METKTRSERPKERSSLDPLLPAEELDPRTESDIYDDDPELEQLTREEREWEQARDDELLEGD